jgi:hypothetical protein
MEVAEPARRQPHPQGRNEEEDGRDAAFWSAASARNGAARGKNCGKRSAGRCGYEATGRLTSIMTRQRWKRRIERRLCNRRYLVERRQAIDSRSILGDYRKSRRAAIK